MMYFIDMSNYEVTKAIRTTEQSWRNIKAIAADHGMTTGTMLAELVDAYREFYTKIERGDEFSPEHTELQEILDSGDPDILGIRKLLDLTSRCSKVGNGQ